jgi:predicted amidohydrolase YtcJ
MVADKSQFQGQAEADNIYEIKNCYDSHTHFLATGETQQGLSLNFMRHQNDVSQIQIKPDFLRSDWLIGFGWDQNLWSDSRLPNLKTLDLYFPDRPVFFSRVDGHSSWINSRAVQEFKKKGFDFNVDVVGGKIHRDENGFTGILSDQAHIKALMMLPAFSEQQIQKFCLNSMNIFNQAGFTHVRDLSMNSQLWKTLCEIQEAGRMTVCLDSFVTSESVSDLERAYLDYLFCEKNKNPYLRIHGLKIFVDGSLGSKTAFLSEPYSETDSFGLISWTNSEIESAIQFCWSKKIAIAVHVIGDEAVHQVALAARSVSARGFEGKIHLEHVQILRPETLSLLKSLHVTIHMQPCHWLSDHLWLDQVVSKNILENQFQWQKIDKNKIPLYFGSDSPIEVTSLLNNKKAIELSPKCPKFKIPKLESDWKKHHSHPDQIWTKSKTVFNDSEILSVYFDGKQII